MVSTSSPAPYSALPQDEDTSRQTRVVSPDAVARPGIYYNDGGSFSPPSSNDELVPENEKSLRFLDNDDEDEDAERFGGQVIMEAGQLNDGKVRLPHLARTGPPEHTTCH